MGQGWRSIKTEVSVPHIPGKREDQMGNYGRKPIQKTGERQTNPEHEGLLRGKQLLEKLHTTDIYWVRGRGIVKGGKN